MVPNAMDGHEYPGPGGGGVPPEDVPEACRGTSSICVEILQPGQDASRRHGEREGAHSSYFSKQVRKTA